MPIMIHRRKHQRLTEGEYERINEVIEERTFNSPTCCTSQRVGNCRKIIFEHPVYVRCDDSCRNDHGNVRTWFGKVFSRLSIEQHKNEKWNKQKNHVVFVEKTKPDHHSTQQPIANAPGAE